MARRIKTIEFATSTNITSLAATTNRDLSGSTSIYIPETGITFKSAIVYVDCVNDITNTSAADLTSPIIGIILDGIASNVTLPDPIQNSGEKEAWIFSRDVTSYFSTNWSGSTMTWLIRVNFTGMQTNNHAAKIVITYEYEDSSSPTEHIKTIRIPIESTRSLLTTSWQTVGGTTAIPALKNFGASPYLPETGITIRQIFLEMWGNTATLSTTDFTWQTRIDGVTAIDTYRNESAMNSATWAHAIIDITTATLTGATALECICNGITNRFSTVGGMIVVTYSFNPSTSTSIYNSLMIGAVDTAGQVGNSGSTGSWEKNIYVEEPGTIQLKESGLCLFQDDSQGYTFNVKVSGDTTSQETYQSYIITAGAVQCGTYSLVHRIDASGQTGAAGISLVKGKNLYRVLFYTNTAQAGWNLSGFLILNYISGKYTTGIGSHSHSVYQHVADNITTNGSRINISSTITPSIPETNYFLNEYLYWINYNIGASTDSFFVVDAENINNGWNTLYIGTSRQDNENKNGWVFGAGSKLINRWNGDPDPDKLNIKTGRRYRLSAGPLESGSMGYWYTYHSISYEISGTCSGYIGNGTGITVDIYRINSSTQNEMILSTTTTEGGVFSTTWYNNTETLYAAARQDDNHVGRSKNGTAG